MSKTQLELRYQDNNDSLIECYMPDKPKNVEIVSNNAFTSKKYHPELLVKELSEFFGFGYNDKDDKPSVDYVRDRLRVRGVNQSFRIRALMYRLLSDWKRDLRSMSSLLHSYKEIMTKAYKDDKYKFYTIRNKYIQVKGSYKELCSNYMQLRAVLNSSPDISYPLEHSVWGDIRQLPVDFPENPNKDFIHNMDRITNYTQPEVKKVTEEILL